MSDSVVDALRLGKAMEREAIVSWLREPQKGTVVVAPWCELLADSIERGEHDV